MKIIFQLFILLLLSIPLKAQSFKFSKNFDSEDSTQIHILETYRGDIFRGRVAVTGQKVLKFVTAEDVVIKFKLFEVRNVFVEGKDRIERFESNQITDTFPTQILFLGATAFSMPQGTHLFNNTDLLWNSYDVGVGKGVSVGVAALLPFIQSARIKYSYPLDKKIHIGLNLQFYNSWLNGLGSGLKSNIFFANVITLGKPTLFLNLTTGFYLPVLRKEEAKITSENLLIGLGFGGENHKVVYKLEIVLYQDMRYNRRTGREQYTDILPLASIGWKSKRSKYEFGIVSFPYFKFFPYASFKTRFK